MASIMKSSPMGSCVCRNYVHSSSIIVGEWMETSVTDCSRSKNQLLCHMLLIPARASEMEILVKVTAIEGKAYVRRNSILALTRSRNLQTLTRPRKCMALTKSRNVSPWLGQETFSIDKVKRHLALTKSRNVQHWSGQETYERPFSWETYQENA